MVGIARRHLKFAAAMLAGSLVVLASVAAWQEVSRTDPVATTAEPTTTLATTPETTTSTKPPALLTIRPADRGAISVGTSGTKLAGSLVTFVKSLPADACLVVDEGNSRVVAHRSTNVLAPASTQKLFTATAVLNVLGPEHRFTTQVVSSAPLQGSTIAGDVYLVGDGDPVLSTTTYQASQRHQPALATSIELLADRVVAAGVKRVTGTIIGDEHKFANDRFLPTWGYPYDYTTRTGPLSALVLNDGWIASDQVQPDPPAFAARSLQRLLEKRGVTFGAQAISGQAPSVVTTLASVESPQLQAIVDEMLRNSDNMTAELLAKDLDVARHGIGRIDTAALTVLSTLKEEGFALDGVDMRDASGTDKANRASCADLVYMLHSIGNASDTSGNGLPTAGMTGTLSARYNNTAAAGRVHAKTGSILGAAALAGFVDPPPGSREPEITFAFLVNGTDNDTRYTLEDNLIDVLASWNLG